MPVRITEGDTMGLEGSFVRYKTIVNMVQNFIDKTYKRRENGDVVKVKKDKDSHAVYFSRNEIEALFAANEHSSIPKDKMGIRIYFSVHGSSDEENEDMPNRPARYLGHHAAVLVCTNDRKDLLKKGDAVSIYGRGEGYDEGEICPPPSCGEIEDDLTP